MCIVYVGESNAFSIYVKGNANFYRQILLHGRACVLFFVSTNSLKCMYWCGWLKNLLLIKWDLFLKVWQGCVMVMMLKE